MLDLYGISNSFPGLQESQKLNHLPEEKAVFLERKFKADILMQLENDSSAQRFIPYLQLHEFEAYLFSDTKAFKAQFPDDDDKISALQGIVDAFESPERINDKPETAPSKRIIKLYPEYERGKVKFGPSIAKEIGLEKIREKCPHFSSWISRLERIGDII